MNSRRRNSSEYMALSSLRRSSSCLLASSSCSMARSLAARSASSFARRAAFSAPIRFCSSSTRLKSCSSGSIAIPSEAPDSSAPASNSDAECAGRPSGPLTATSGAATAPTAGVLNSLPGELLAGLPSPAIGASPEDKIPSSGASAAQSLASASFSVADKRTANLHQASAHFEPTTSALNISFSSSLNVSAMSPTSSGWCSCLSAISASSSKFWISFSVLTAMDASQSCRPCISSKKLAGKDVGASSAWSS
mmetsp:Transcript_68878/g.120593  ORF Transcript_68878/g.120593 Transcript_68878/m.120593 type:complete len:251 (+) Transcript_68878:2542-3294(+)